MDLLEPYGKIIQRKFGYKDAIDLWNKGDTYDLLYLAYLIKKYYNYKNNNSPLKMDLCSIINAKSGRCSEDCIFCSQSTYSKSNIKIYGLGTEYTILRTSSRFCIYYGA